MPEQIFVELRRYVHLLMRYQRYGNKGLKMSFDRGYWWSVNDNSLRGLEENFLSISVRAGPIIRALRNEPQSGRRTLLIHLLGWSKQTSLTTPIFLKYLEDPNVRFCNAAARALFPLVAAHKVSIDHRSVLKLLRRRSKYCKNKALGLLSWMPQLDVDLTHSELIYIKTLTQHEDQRFIALPARAVMKNYKTRIQHAQRGEGHSQSSRPL